jgi:NAD(P)-dependent dehydrogenase (short-subunit alcohol dehydrogenase family)
MSLEGRDIVVTGAAGALGGAVADALLAAGARCHLPVLEAKAAAPDERLRWVAGVDLADEQAVAAFYAGCPPLWGSVHIAGGFRAGALVDTSVAELRQQLDQNLVTAFLCCREAARNMRRAGAGGRIVNVGSRATVAPAGGTIAYTIAKAAVGALTAAAADELKDDRILVNAVLPSTIDTAANRAAMPHADQARWPKPAEIAAAIAWLVSPENSVTSGALLPVYGRA